MAPKAKRTPSVIRYLGDESDRTEYRVIDATDPVSIQVNRSDYKLSKCGDVEACALSTALKRNDSEVLRVFTGLTSAYVIYSSDPKTAIRYAVPAGQRDAIAAFDRTGYMAPGTYRFTVVAPSIRLGARVGQTGSKVRRSGQVKVIANGRPMLDRTVPTRRVNARKSKVQ